MFHQLMVKHVVEVQSTKAQVDELCSQAGHHPQADNLTQSFILGPRGRVNIRTEDVTVRDVQHIIHGTICEFKAAGRSVSVLSSETKSTQHKLITEV